MMTNSPVRSNSPALSAVVVIPDTFAAVARTVASLYNQSVVSQIELVFVHPPLALDTIPIGSLEQFHSIQTCQVPDITLAAAMAEGARHAHAPIVAFTEDHAFPAPNWAERLIAAHREPYAVIGPAIRCGNPHSLVSLADFYIGYGKWAEPVQSGVQDFLMGHNASYKRALLMEYDAQLTEMLDAETVLQFELAQRGYQFWLEATTYTEHLNCEDAGFWGQYLLYFGRVFAARRAAMWSLPKRALYAAAAPLIPFVRFLRMRQDVARAQFPPGKRWRLYSVILAGLMVDAAGQCLGYAFGRGTIASREVEFEFHRERHIAGPAAVAAE